MFKPKSKLNSVQCGVITWIQPLGESQTAILPNAISLVSFMNHTTTKWDVFTWSGVTRPDGILLPQPKMTETKLVLLELHARGPAITATFVWYYPTRQDAHKTFISGTRVSVSRWRDEHIGLNIKLLKANDLWEDICVICVIPAKRHRCFLASLTGQSSRLAVWAAQKTPT